LRSSPIEWQRLLRINYLRHLEVVYLEVVATGRGPLLGT
jgi:hypothetical protein